MFRVCTGSRVIVDAKVVLPVANVPPRSSVVAAKTDGRTRNPFTRASTYLLFVASVGSTGSSTIFKLIVRSSIVASTHLRVATSPGSSGSKALIIFELFTSRSKPDAGEIRMLSVPDIVPALNVSSPTPRSVRPTISFVVSPRVTEVLPNVIY